MTFYNNKVVAIEILDRGIYLARFKNNSIYIEFIKEKTNIFQTFEVIPNCIDEFDIDLDINNNINILYLNNIHDLILTKLHNKEVADKIILKGIKKRIFYITLINENDNHNLFYMQETEHGQIYTIHHINIEGDSQTEFIVDEIELYQIINPIRVIKEGKFLLLSYYYKNQICIKEFDSINKIWSHTITLTDNQNKLYLDMMMFSNMLHLVYANYVNDNFVIKYERFNFDNDNIIREKEIKLSNSGNNTDPILVKLGETIWVIWKNANHLVSIYSTNNGDTWSDIYQWSETKKMDIVKYKYLTNILDERFKIEYSYGAISKDIKFLGFGNTDKTEIIERKK